MVVGVSLEEEVEEELLPDEDVSEEESPLDVFGTQL